MQTEPWKLVAASIVGGMSLALVGGAAWLAARHRAATSQYSASSPDSKADAAAEQLNRERKAEDAHPASVATSGDATSGNAQPDGPASGAKPVSEADGLKPVSAVADGAAKDNAEKHGAEKDGSATRGVVDAVALTSAAASSAPDGTSAVATLSGASATNRTSADTTAATDRTSADTAAATGRTAASSAITPTRTYLTRRALTPKRPPRPVDDLLDMDGLGRDLMRARDPYAKLRHLVRDVERREQPDSADVEPDAISRYLARGLGEAGLLDDAASLPSTTVIRPSRSRTFFLRVDDENVAWGDVMRVLAIEGALNRALFAWDRFGKPDGREDETDDDGETDDGGLTPSSAAYRTGGEPRALANGIARGDEAPTVEDCYRFNQALASSITAQVGTSPIPAASMTDVLGEWGVRQSISAGIESFRLPLRLTAEFRVNLMGGDAAFQISYVPEEAQPASVFSSSLGRVVSASWQMRAREAADYAMHCALLLVSHAFRSSRRLCHVFVAVVSDTPKGRACLLSGDVSRERFRELDLSVPYDPAAVCRGLGMRLRIEDDRLLEVEQGFSLESERFCPRSRYESPDLSNRILPRFEAHLLGAERVSDLAINENARRDVVAQRLIRELGPSTAKNVHEILDLTKDDKDPTVREAGRRCAEGLISGKLRDGDVLALEDEFVEGDELTRACRRASALLEKGKTEKAIDVLTDALAPVDALDVYRDRPGQTWREFTSYVGRTLYNRLLAKPGEHVRLAPDSYFGAQLLMATALIAGGRPEQALGFARRAQDLNPLDVSGTLRAVRALELLGCLEDATDEIKRYLKIAFDPQGIGVCYYRLAYLEWQLGKIELADACYQKAIVSRASVSGTAMLELQTMRLTSGGSEVEPADVDDVLERAGIPLAPTERVVNVLVEAAQAATDAEVFPVARSFAGLLGLLSGDDVINGVANSIEHEPDR